MLAPLALTTHQPASSVTTRRGPTAPGSPTQGTWAQSGLRSSSDLLNHEGKGEATIQRIKAIDGGYLPCFPFLFFLFFLFFRDTIPQFVYSLVS